MVDFEIYSMGKRRLFDEMIFIKARPQLLIVNGEIVIEKRGGFVRKCSGKVPIENGQKVSAY